MGDEEGKKDKGKSIKDKGQRREGSHGSRLRREITPMCGSRD